MNIDGINTGYVLDHIKAGKGFELYHLLGLDKADCTVAIIQRASSAKYGAKDIIKIDAESGKRRHDSAASAAEGH